MRWPSPVMNMAWGARVEGSEKGGRKEVSQKSEERNCLGCEGSVAAEEFVPRDVT